MKKQSLMCLLHFGLILSFAMICFFIIQHSPNTWRVSSIKINVPEAGNIELGYASLGQKNAYRSAEKQHIAFRRGTNGIEIANISSHKKIDAKTDCFDTLFIKRFPLHIGDKIIIKDTTIEVLSTSQTSLKLRETKTNDSIEWNNDYLVYKDKTLKSPSWKKQFVRWLSQFFPSLKMLNPQKTSEVRLFGLGGSLNLHNQWGINGLIPQSAYITWLDGQFYVAPGNEYKTLFLPDGQTNYKAFQDAWTPLQGKMGTIERLIMGSTYYKIHQEKNTVFLYPLSRKDVFVEEPDAIDNDSITINYDQGSWIGSGKDIKTWFAADVNIINLAIISAIGLIITAIFWFYVYHTINTVLPSTLLLAALVPSSTLFFVFGGALGMEWPVLLCCIVWLWTTYVLWRNNKMNLSSCLLWLCAIALCGISLVTLLQLFAGSTNTRWATYLNKQLWASIGLAYAVAFLSYIPSEQWARMRRYLAIDRQKRWSSWGFQLGICIAIIILMLFYAGWGSEEGISGFQPSEFLKFIFVILSSLTALSLYCFREYGDIGQYSKLNIFMSTCFAGSLAYIIALISFAFVRDISPICILACFALCWLWKIAPAPTVNDRHTSLSCLSIRFCVLIALTLLAGSMIWIYISPQFFKDFLPQFDRFATWSNPMAYPHSGAQVIGSMKMVASGGWFGAGDDIFSSNGMANSLPAVQDDFILAFLLYKFGAIAGLFLLFVQVVYFATLWHIGNCAKNIQKSYDQRYSSYVLYFTIHGLALIHAFQWTISWGNTLGLLPVMGQPMTWLSAGNSHFIAIGCTTLILALLATWSLQEKE